jgi:hypothetical protein
MWNLVVITVLAAMASVYASLGERTAAVIEPAMSRDTAENMALYREAVIQYYTANDVKNYSVDLETMKAANVVPTWSTLYTNSATAIWANFRAADGTIYVYAASLPSMNIQADLARVSRNSYLVGMYKRQGQTLYSPVYGDTGISLAALASKHIPDNAPVWIGYRR